MNIAVILAGGTGSRVGSDIPKQFLKVAGKKIIEHTIDVFEKNSNIDEICVVCNPMYISMMEDIILNNHYKKVKKVLNGGKERYESSLAAIDAYTDDDTNLIFHDAVRPLVNDRIIDDCIYSLQSYDAVDVAIGTADTIIKTIDGSTIDSVPYRPELRNGQTPQCFKRYTIKKAYELALADPNFKTTDDCSVVLKYLPDTPIKIVKGEVSNLKITYIEDIYLLDKLFQLKKEAVSSKDFSQLKDKVIVVFGGTSGIGKEIVKICRDNGASVYALSRRTGIDINDFESVRSALQGIYDTTGRIDSIINTVGVLYKEPFDSMDHIRIMETINANYLSCVTIAKLSHKYLTESRGSLVFFTSSSYTKGRKLYSIYSSTKAAIVNFTQAIAEEWENDGIRVNCINPARTATPMRTKAFGIEPENTLLDPIVVAEKTIDAILSDFNGEVIDIKL